MSMGHIEEFCMGYRLVRNPQVHFSECMMHLKHLGPTKYAFDKWYNVVITVVYFECMLFEYTFSYKKRKHGKLHHVL